ncbi:MAG: AAA family ATPase [Vicinamibacteria bacterium]|nr:AAA family ATPase [Vicinamibacteria bacterium]
MADPTPPPTTLPAWAEEMRGAFRSGAASQFVLHGNVFDLVEGVDGKGGREWVSLARFLETTMFAPFDVVLVYDRGRGLRARRGAEPFYRFLKAFDTFSGTNWASMPDPGTDKLAGLDFGNLLPRDPKRAIEIVDRFLRHAVSRTKVQDARAVADPLRVAVIVDHAQFVAPAGDPAYVSESSQTVIQLLDWSRDPQITGAVVATALIAENLSDLNKTLVENPHSSKVKLSLPTGAEIRSFVHDLVAGEDFDKLSEVPKEALADKLVGLTRVGVRTLVRRAMGSGERISGAFLTRMKKELIEKEAAGRLEFLETDRTLDDVAGHVEAKAWLREDAVLLKRGKTRAIPMGYLLTGRIGTGKTYLVECLAGDIGVPCVEMKNFRDKWVGATEGNLEKVFAILHALGQVIVFVDEADQATGKRGGGDGDSGLGGRIYAMLAKEMSDTRNRGKIIWIFATSRPDLVEVDLKRQGRLDVHIPLFPPGDAEGRAALFAAMARKLKLDIAPADLPRLPDDDQIGGNEMEGVLVRALRAHEAGLDLASRGGAAAPSLRSCIEAAIADFRSSAHVERLELMDLLAVKECTDTRFLPERFRKLSLTDVNARIAHLKAVLGE